MFLVCRAVYQRVKGIESVKPGYAGGHTKNPTYKEICTGKTGHAEVAQIKFDKNIITYEQILNVFWQSHDPTTLNRQAMMLEHNIGLLFFTIIMNKKK